MSKRLSIQIIITDEDSGETVLKKTEQIDKNFTFRDFLSKTIPGWEASMALLELVENAR